ncbi:MAG: galactose-1-epimerase, partial [Bacteroidota bacterium]
MKPLFFFFPLLITAFAACVVEPELHPSPEPERMHAFSDTIDGKSVDLFLLRNENGMEVELSNYGATIVAIRTPDKNGKIEDVTLSYDNLTDLRAGKSYFGCVVGRFANRIGGAQFTLDGQEYIVPKNDGDNALHGGIN